MQKIISDINKQFFDFIAEHLGDDPDSLRLKYSRRTDLGFDINFAILQIQCRQKHKLKIPEILANSEFLFPNELSAEQCTAEQIAKFHSTLFNSDDNVLDMTAGLCIDAFYISQKVKSLTAIELNPEIASIDALNMSKMAQNVSVISCNSIDYISITANKYDSVFIDPARRAENGFRIYAISDCQPNVIALLDSISRISSRLIIKASPMLDITQSLRELHNVTNVYIVALRNECKELLFCIDFIEKIKPVTIHTINFSTDSVERFNYLLEDLSTEVSSAIPEPEQYLYEPNVCVMKTNAFGLLSSHFNIDALHANTHLFISSRFIADFPGRKFRINEILPYHSSEIKSFSRHYPAANIAVRNFPLTASQLKKKLKVSDGGDVYLFGVTLCDGSQALIICSKAVG
ncbi:MAG: hypothetical protein LKF31_02105 [Muribaculaceae bacterium]|jgi:hypothetical protein|nr:hypothetical protein [Muribaculaceae bacterium]